MIYFVSELITLSGFSRVRLSPLFFDSRRPSHNVRLVYLLLAGTATLGFVCTLKSAYSCKFAKVTEVKVSTTHLIMDGTSSIPAYFGIWKIQARPQSSEVMPDFESNNECLPWGQSLWEQNGVIRASKSYAVIATVIGTFLWLLILWGACQKITGNLLFVLCSLSLVCEALAALFFEIMGAQTCYQYGMQCSWDIGAFYAAGAVLMWMSTAIGFALYQPKPHVEEASVDGADSTPNHANNSNNAPATAPASPPPTNNTSGNQAAEAETNPTTFNDTGTPSSVLQQDEETGMSGLQD